MNARTKRCLGKYFKGYRALVDNHSGTGIQGFESFIRRLATDLPALRKSRHQQELLLAPQYNIFRVLPIERREAVLHSPMLAHLLDPTASHGQGCLFLRAFFQVAHMNARLPPPAEPLDASQWSVRKEVYIGNGSLDLLIECPMQKYVLVIENKIDAAEQHTQLSRYYRWLKEDRADYATQRLILLTRTGRASESSRKVPCVLMSYHRDIREILNETVDQVRAPRVKELVGQYQAILNNWAQEETNEELIGICFLAPRLYFGAPFVLDATRVKENCFSLSFIPSHSCQTGRRASTGKFCRVSRDVRPPRGRGGGRWRLWRAVRSRGAS